MILHDDGSTKAETLAVLERFKGLDPRIKISFGRKNQGISAATNTAIELSSGEFAGFLDNDDELEACALAEMVRAINENRDVDLLYSDEDKINPDGAYCDHYYKPDWSPEHLESVMYLLHFLVIRRSVLLAAGGIRPQYSGAQDYDLALRVTRQARRIVHVPKILYHWRKIEGSAAAIVDAKPDALLNGERALQDHLDASKRSAKVVPGLAPGIFRVRDHIPAGLPVTLAINAGNRAADIPGRGKINVFDHFFTSIVEKSKTAGRRDRGERREGRIVQSFATIRQKFRIGLLRCALRHACRLPLSGPSRLKNIELRTKEAIKCENIDQRYSDI